MALSSQPPLARVWRWRLGDPRDALRAQGAWVLTQTLVGLTGWTSAFGLALTAWLGLGAAILVLEKRPAPAPWQRAGPVLLVPLALVGILLGQRVGAALVQPTGPLTAAAFALVVSLVASCTLILATVEVSRVTRLPGAARLAHLPESLRVAVAQAREATGLLDGTPAADLAHSLSVEVLRAGWRAVWIEDRLARIGSGGERVEALRAELDADRCAAEAGVRAAREALAELCLAHTLGTLDHELPALVARARSDAEARGAVARAAREVGLAGAGF